MCNSPAVSSYWISVVQALVPLHHFTWLPSDMRCAKVSVLHFHVSGSNWPPPLLQQASLGLRCWIWSMLQFVRFGIRLTRLQGFDPMTALLHLQCAMQTAWYWDVWWMFSGVVVHHAHFDLQSTCSSLRKVLHNQHTCTQLHSCINGVTGGSQERCHSLLNFYYHLFSFLRIFFCSTFLWSSGNQQIDTFH